MKRAALVLSVVAMASSGCSDLTVVRPVVVRPSQAASPELFERLVSATASQGYAMQLVQPSRGRFAARARFADEHGRYTLAVECFANGEITITPVGPRVQRHAGEWILPWPLGEELVDLAAALDRAARGG